MSFYEFSNPQKSILCCSDSKYVSSGNKAPVNHWGAPQIHIICFPKGDELLFRGQYLIERHLKLKLLLQSCIGQRKGSGSSADRSRDRPDFVLLLRLMFGLCDDVEAGVTLTSPTERDTRRHKDREEWRNCGWFSHRGPSLAITCHRDGSQVTKFS